MKNTIRTITLGGIAAAALVLVAPMAASAHISATASTTAAGSHAVVTLALPHGCEGSSTTSIAIDIPATIDSVTPTVNYGWDVATVPDGERTSQVVYTAKTPLSDGLRDTFDLQVVIPEDAEGQTLAFPVTQTCEVGETLWNEETVDGEEEPEHPAPAFVVTAAAEGDGHGHAEDDGEHEEAEPESDSSETLALGLGIAGLALGAAALITAVVALRTREPKA
jgi:uncharacterized protein YcnI